jgi:hypothetical protein
MRRPEYRLRTPSRFMRPGVIVLWPTSSPSWLLCTRLPVTAVTSDKDQAALGSFFTRRLNGAASGSTQRSKDRSRGPLALS